VDKTRTKLTKEEQKARKQWNEKREEFARKWCFRAPYRVPVDQWLTSFLLPPLLEDRDLQSACSMYNELRKKRRYPHEIDVWTDFSKIELNTRMSTELLFHLLGKSILYEGKVRNESQEQAFLEQNVWGPLIQAGLMHGRSNVEAIPGLQASHSSPVIGLPDNVSYAGGDVVTAGHKTIVMECKSSHNLLIPNEIDKLKQRYENAVKHQMQSQSKDCSSDWSHICHPLGQLFAYMLDYNVHFGALCSASW